MKQQDNWSKNVFASLAMATALACSAARADVLTLESPAPSINDGDVTQPFSLVRLANPADKQRAPQTQPAGDSKTHHSWEMPPVVVLGEKAPELHEEERIGGYAQPRWTADRRFPGTRIYVIPEGKVEYEYWLRSDIPRHGNTEFQHMHEIEFGLPYRLQIDLYLIQRYESGGGETFMDSSFELRYAFTDWGKIWGNPALYAEYTHHDGGPETVEFKLLLGDQFAPKWHWGLNFVFEHDTGDEYVNTYEVTAGVSYTLIDEKLSVGGEIKTSLNTFHGDRSNYNEELLVGPSLQWRPLPQMHLDFVPLIGVTGNSPAAELFFVLGYEF